MTRRLILGSADADIMPEPTNANANNHDSNERDHSYRESTPLSRQNRLHHALQTTSALAADATSILNSSHNATGSVNGRRRRRPSSDFDHDEVLPTTHLVRDVGDGRPGPKRPRLMIRPPGLAHAAIKYGYHGQVRPGKLRLTMISCDGGEHVDSRYPNISLAARNILVHDKSVYSSTNADSNITLGHADNLPFCLEKLHIIGPEDGFTAPVQKGTVHVAMTMRALERYRDPPSYARRSGSNPIFRTSLTERHPPRESSERLSLLDALHDQEINGALARRQRLSSEYYNSVHEAISPGSNSAADVENHVVLNEALPENQDTIGEYSSYTCTPPWTTLMDDDPGEEDDSSQAVLDFRRQRLRTMRRRYEIEDLDHLDRWGAFSEPREVRSRDYSRDRSHYYPYSSRLDAFMARSGHYDRSPQAHASRQSSNPIHLNDPARLPAAAGDDVVGAEFAIQHGHKITICFNPAVSGRFIMLKLQANNTNVDVQSVIAVGYAGPRFFPATECV